MLGRPWRKCCGPLPVLFIYLSTCFYFFYLFLLKFCLIYAHLVNRKSCTTKRNVQMSENMLHWALAQNTKRKVCKVLQSALERGLKCNEIKCNHSGKQTPDLFPLSPSSLLFWGRERHLKPPLISPSHTSLLSTPARLVRKNKTGPGTENPTTFHNFNAGALLVKDCSLWKMGDFLSPHKTAHVP